MKLQKRILALACLMLVLIIGSTPAYPRLSSIFKSELKPGPDTVAGKFFEIKPFQLDIIAPSSGVQFYLNGIIFLSHGKGEEKVPDKHVSFGSIKTFMAPVLDTVPGNFQPFLPSTSKVFPSEAVTFTANYKIMYLSLIPDKGNKEKIFKARMESDSWLIEDEPLNFCKTDYIYSHPSISTDGTLIVFSSDMPGSKGGLDLYVAKKEGEKWSDPANLGQQINSNGNELFASLDSRNNLYFSSDGIPGEGGYDVFVCLFNGIGWEQPLNISKLINSKDDEVAFTVNKTDNKSAFYTSRTKSSKGKTQLYTITLNPVSTGSPEADLSQHILAISGVNESAVKPIQPVATPPAMAVAENVEQKPASSQQTAPAKAVDPKINTAPIKEATPPASKPATVASTEGNKDDVVYRVQILATTKATGSQSITVAGKTYKSFEYLYKGAYRTTIGEFKTMAEAARLQGTCRQNGHSQAFVVAFRNNIRSTDPELFK